MGKDEAARARDKSGKATWATLREWRERGLGEEEIGSKLGLSDEEVRELIDELEEKFGPID